MSFKRIFRLLMVLFVVSLCTASFNYVSAKSLPKNRAKIVKAKRTKIGAGVFGYDLKLKVPKGYKLRAYWWKYSKKNIADNYNEETRTYFIRTWGDSGIIAYQTKKKGGGKWSKKKMFALEILNQSKWSGKGNYVFFNIKIPKVRGVKYYKMYLKNKGKVRYIGKAKPGKKFKARRRINGYFTTKHNQFYYRAVPVLKGGYKCTTCSKYNKKFYHCIGASS